MADAPFYLQWHITSRCNLRCAHCYQSDYADQISETLFQEGLEKFGRHLSRVGAKGQINLTGGEPMLHPDFFSFAQRIREEVNRRFDGDAPAFYRAAGITRFQYSKLLSHPESFRPSKDTALRMALALQYTLDQASGLLALAGHALSPAIPADRVWTVCFLHGMHHLPTVLHFLERYG